MLLAAQATTITDWLQAIGTVGALLLTGGGLLYELRRRRLDQHEAERAAARAVLVTLIPDDLRGPYLRHIRVVLANYGRDPIVHVELGVSPPDPTDEWFIRKLPALGPGEQTEWTWRPAKSYTRPDHETASVMVDFGTQVVFEIAGTRWSRQDRLEPVRASYREPSPIERAWARVWSWRHRVRAKSSDAALP